MTFTAIIEKSDDGWYVGQLEEMPAAISQGRTIEEVKKNLLDALKLLMEANKESMKRAHRGKSVVRRRLRIE